MNSSEDPFLDSYQPSTALSKALTRLSRRYQSLLDAWTPHIAYRWMFTSVVFMLFMARVFICQGWYIIAYGLGIYFLNMLISFLTPKADPAIYDNFDEDGPSLPTSANEEFRPFIRRLPEFKFWYSSTRATVVALICTFFDVCNIPVFWPFLLIWFITIFCILMKRQIKHMIKHRYLPWSHGKTRYQGRD